MSKFPCPAWFFPLNKIGAPASIENSDHTKEMPRAEIEVVCPDCGNIAPSSGRFKRQKCFFNPEKNLWHCFQCGAGGQGEPSEPGFEEVLSGEEVSRVDNSKNFTDHSFLQNLQSNLQNSSEAFAYLCERFGDLDWREENFNLGYDPARHAISIEVRGLDGELKGIKYRSLDPEADPKYTSEPGSAAGFYFLPATSRLPKHGFNKDWLLITEGEFDAMSARIMGWEGAVLAMQTNRLTHALKPKLTELFQKVTRLYVAADNDLGGGVLKDELASLGFKAKTYFVETHSVKDLSELLQQSREKAPETFLNLLRAVRSEVGERSYTAAARLEQSKEFLLNPLNTTGWPTGFPLLDEQLGGGYLPHTLTALSAPAKSGKTTLLIQFIFNLLKQNKKVGFLSLEMNAITHVIPSLLSIIFERNMRRQTVSGIEEVYSGALEAAPYLNNLIFFDGSGVTPAEIIYAWIEFEYTQNGVELFFLDHVGYSLQDIKDPSQHSVLSKTLRRLTRDFPIHILAVVQPKHLERGNKRVSKHDLYGSITWSQDLNQLITVDKVEDLKLHVRLTDSHNPVARPSEDPIVLFYDPETCSYSASKKRSRPTSPADLSVVAAPSVAREYTDQSNHQ